MSPDTSVEVSITFVDSTPNRDDRYLVAINMTISNDNSLKRTCYLEFLTADEILDIAEDPRAYAYGGIYRDPE